MRVVVSVGGRFHAFYLAQQLLKKSYLARLITTYPKFEVVKYGIPRQKISSIVIPEIMFRVWKKLPYSTRKIYNSQYLIHEIFDRLAERNLCPADIVVSWSSFGLHTIRKAKQKGIVTIIDRGSSHMLYQTAVIKEEYEKFGINTEVAHPKIIEKELTEYQEADYISVPSLFVKRTFLDEGIPEEKIIHVPYGVHLSEFKPLPKADNVFRIIYAGGMTLAKGVQYLLKAFYQLNLPNSELLLVGSIHDEVKPIFKQYQGYYRWVNHVPQRELYKYYSQASCFALMSLEEGLALVLVQAMACGLPLICTTNTGCEDLIEDDKEGFIIPIRDIEALKEKILFFYKNPKKYTEMGQLAKRKVQRRFTWDDYGHGIINEYQKILNKN